MILTLEQKAWTLPDVADSVRMFCALLALSLAAVIAFFRPHDLQARVGAWLLAEVALFGLFFLNG